MDKDGINRRIDARNGERIRLIFAEYEQIIRHTRTFSLFLYEEHAEIDIKKFDCIFNPQQKY